MHHTINERGGGLEMEKSLKDMTRILLFLAVANLPFITIVQVTGLDIFLDSFENPSYYLYLEYNNSIGNMETKHSYIIVQKSSHPNFSINFINFLSNNSTSDKNFQNFLSPKKNILSYFQDL